MSLSGYVKQRDSRPTTISLRMTEELWDVLSELKEKYGNPTVTSLIHGLILEYGRKDLQEKV